MESYYHRYRFFWQYYSTYNKIHILDLARIDSHPGHTHFSTDTFVTFLINQNVESVSKANMSEIATEEMEKNYHNLLASIGEDPEREGKLIFTHGAFYNVYRSA